MNASTNRNQDIPAILRDGSLRPMPRWRKTLYNLRYEYGYLLFAALIPAVIVYLLYLVRGIYPFGNGSVLVLDLTHQYVYFYEALYDILHGDADLFYSFSRNLGGEFMGIYDYYVASPFALLLGLLPKDWMHGGLLALFMLKAGLCGLTMGIYLHKHADGRLNRLNVLAFSLMYALCSYCIVQQHNSMWIDAVLWLPLLTLGIEELIKRGKFRLYVFALAIIIWSNYYIGYMVVFYTIAYCFYYYFAHNRANENNPLGEKAHFIKSVGRVLMWSVLAVGIAALVILTARYSLSFGKDEFRKPDWSITQTMGIFEMLQKFFPSSFDTVHPAGRPFVYCGVLTLMLVPAFFMSKKFSMREKIAASFFILFFLASFFVSTLDLIWHGFQKPNWLNYRYSFMLCFFLVVLAYRAFTKIEFTSRKSLLGAIVAIGTYVIILPEFAEYFLLTYNGSDLKASATIRPFATVGLTLACLLVYFILISLYGKLKARRQETVSLIMVFVICVELFLSGVADMEELNTDVVYTTYSTHHNMIDTFRPISNALEEYDEGFYRTGKVHEKKKNEAFAFRLKGLASSTSTFNRDTIDFLKSMGYDAQDHNSYYRGGTPVNDSLLGLKYFITSNEKTGLYGEPVLDIEDFDYPEDFSFPEGQHKVYLNQYAQSLIYGVDDQWLTYNIDDYDTPFERINAMITAMLGEDETVEVFVPITQLAPFKASAGEQMNEMIDPSEQPYLIGVEKDGTNSNNQRFTRTADNGSITYNFVTEPNVEVYYYTPSTLQYEIKLTGNAVDAPYEYSVNIVPLGKTTDDGQMNLKVTIPKGKTNVYIPLISEKENADTGESTYEMRKACLYYLDEAVFADAMARLQELSVVIEEGYSDSHMLGSVTTTAERQLMFTSIPYDEGWNIYVDGEKVDIYESVGALISFHVEGAGEHEIELRYMPRAISLGLSISIVCGLIYLLVLILYPFAKRVPILRKLVMIEGEELPELMTPEKLAGIEPGDIGAPSPEETPNSSDRKE